jgi:large-conductance mechanosensitive channel
MLLLVQPILAWKYRGLILREEVPPEAIGQIVPAVAFGMLLASLVAGVVWLARRFRRSRGTERLQLKWFAFGVAVLVGAMLTDIFVLEPLGVAADSRVRELMYWPFLLPPLSAGVAILRHRLYDIDRIINRTVVYAAVTVVLGAAYVGAITAMRMVTASFTGDTALAVAASTLAVAALFQPVRRRIQAAVDRRFNRARYDAAATIERFSTRLRDEIDLDTLSGELVEVVGTTMQPAAARLWLRDVGS